MNNNENELKRREVLRMSNEQSHKLTLECIRSALIYLMGIKPYEKITITEIINRSGVSRAAFYRNYSGKDEVLQDEMTEVTNVLKATLSNSLLENNPKEWLVSFFEMILNNKTEIELLQKANLPVEQIFDNLIVANNGTDKMIRYKYGIFFSSLWVIVKIWIDEKYQETPEELAKLIIPFFNTH